MKKIFIIIATILTIMGLAIFIYALSVAGFDLSKLSTIKYETNTYTVDEDFSKIEIDTDITNIIFKKASDEKFKVICEEQEKVKHTVSVEDGILKIGYEDNREWYDYFNFFFKSMSITIYLPSNEYESLSIENSTGNINIPESLSFDDINLTADTGNITCNASANKNIEIKTSTGNIVCNNSKSKSMKITASTGNVKLNNIDIDKLNISVSTGNITLKNVVADKSFNIESSTGNVNFEESNADNITVETSTGNVKGTLKSAKIFIAKSDTGRINVPETTTGGKCKITTSTGNIDIKISK